MIYIYIANYCHKSHHYHPSSMILVFPESIVLDLWLESKFFDSMTYGIYHAFIWAEIKQANR